MKKIIASAVLALAATSALAEKTVQIIWPFAVGSSQANMYRAMIETANSQQSKYNFILVSKPGAGGSVAATHVLSGTGNDLMVLASTSSFYIRPLLYKESHDVDKFELIGGVCSAQPLAIFSKKKNSVADLSDGKFTVGVIPGSITTLFTRIVKKENPTIKLTEIPYKGTPEATTDMLGGHIDGSVDFMGKATLSRFTDDVHVIGLTGDRNIGNYKSFKTLGLKGLEGVVNDYFLFVPKDMDIEVRKEFNAIFAEASRASKVKELCEDDFGKLITVRYNDLPALHDANKKKWERFTEGVSKE